MIKKFAFMALAWVVLGNTPAKAVILTFFGEDLNNSPTVPLAAFPNASGAASNFLSNLVGVGTETFEGLAGGAPLALNFPGAGTATLSGGGGVIVTNTQGSTNGVGRYGVTNDGGLEHFWEVNAGASGNFQVAFSNPIAAFGFYGIDIGDFGGQLQLQTTGGSNVLLNVPNTVGSNGSTDGSVLFYGFIATTAGETVNSLSFLTSTGQGDVFAFDNFTVGSLQQVQPTIPEPSSFLIGLGLFSAFGAFRRNRT